MRVIITATAVAIASLMVLGLTLAQTFVASEQLRSMRWTCEVGRSRPEKRKRPGVRCALHATRSKAKLPRRFESAFGLSSMDVPVTATQSRRMG